MTQTDYIKSKLTTVDRIKGWLFLVPASVLMLGIIVAMVYGMEEVPRVAVIIFVVMFPVAVWAHMSVSAKVERLRREWLDGEMYDRDSGCRPNDCYWPICKCRYPPKVRG